MLAVLVLALSACQVDATVTVRMRDDGSGVVAVRVVLDPAAVRAAEVANGELEQRVRLADLPAAGWAVLPWKRDALGGATLTVSKEFSSPQEVAGIVREINGADGPLSGFTATRQASTFTTRWKVNGTVDLRAPKLGVTTDQQLVANLTAERVDIPQIETRLTSQLQHLRVRLVADLPDGVRREVSATLGRNAVLHETSARTDVNRLVMLVGGLALAALAVLLLAVGELRGRRRRRAPSDRVRVT